MYFISTTSYEDELNALGLDGTTLDLRPQPPAPADSLDAGFRATMRALASGVVLITTYVGARPWGVTVTSCCSLSVDPARLLVSLMRDTSSCRAIMERGAFGVDLLRDGHAHVARASAARGAPKFIEAEAAEEENATGSPMVAGALAHVDCEVEQVLDGGDHAIFIGRAVAVVAPVAGAGSPLLYYEGGFHHLGARVA